MDKKTAWDTFKNTGNINAYLEFRKIIDIEEKEKIDGAFKGKRNSDIRK